MACHVRNLSPLEPEASFDEDGELLVGESTPEFRIRDEKRSTILLAGKQSGFGLRSEGR